MALDLTALERISGGKRKLYIYYSAADAIATVIGAGYFNNAASMLDKGDVIIVIGAAYTTIDLIFVSSADRAAAVTTVALEGVTTS